MSWRLPEFLLLCLWVVGLTESLMLCFSFRPFFLQGLILYKKTFFAPSLHVPSPTAEQLRENFERQRVGLIVNDLGEGVFGIHSPHGHMIILLFDLLHGTLRFQSTSPTVTLTGRCYWSHLILLLLGLTVALQYNNPVILIGLSIAYLVRYFFHRRTYSIVGGVVMRAWSGDN